MQIIELDGRRIAVDPDRLCLFDADTDELLLSAPYVSPSLKSLMGPTNDTPKSEFETLTELFLYIKGVDDVPPSDFVQRIRALVSRQKEQDA